MLKDKILKRIILSICCIAIMLLLYLFPKTNHKEYVIDTTYSEQTLESVIYLLDKDNYVARVNIALSSNDTNDKVLEIIDFLTVKGSNIELIPDGFTPILPENTKLLNFDISEDGNLKLNFSKDILAIDECLEMQMIESLVYSLTAIDNVKSITILVEGDLLTRLPHSGEILPNPIDRSYGINKSYNIDKIQGTTKTTMYFLSKYDSTYYYVPVTKISNDTNEKVEIIIKELKSSPIYQTNLMSYLNSNVELKNFEVVNSEINLDFNSAILSGLSNTDILEEVTYAINLSIKDNYDVKTVSYAVDNKKIATFDLKSLEN